MPELPEVETIKNAIFQNIGEATIDDVIIHNRQLRKPVPDDMEEKIKNTNIVGYERRAKYLIIHLSNGFSILWHMGMSGKIHIYDKLPDNLTKHSHIIIKTSKGDLVYSDARRFGLFTYEKTDKLKDNPFLMNVGIEPFDKKLDVNYLVKKLKNKKTPIKIALLDQKIIVGIGNIYASEALFGAEISPLRPANELSLKECERLLSEIRATLKKAIDAGGSTLRDYEKPDGSLGYFQNLHCVYNKTGQKCPRCIDDEESTACIEKIVLAGRSTFYCTKTQK